MSTTTLPIITNAPPPAGGSNSGAGDAPEAPAPGQKAKKKFRVVCSVCKKPNHTAAVCRSNQTNFTILSGGSNFTPPGTVISFGSAPAGVKKKKKSKKSKKAEKKTEAVAAKAAESMEIDAKADPDEDQFQYWREEEDSCILKWDFRWTTVCEPRSDGSVLLKNNQFERSGNVTFKLRPGAKTARKAIAEYDDCPIGGTAIKLERNHTVGCPILAEDASPKPKPCDLDVKKARSSLAEAVAKPTTSLTEIPSKTTDVGVVTGTNSGTAPTDTGVSTGNGDGAGADNDSGTQSLSLGGLTGILTLLGALSGSIALSLFL